MSKIIKDTAGVMHYQETTLMENVVDAIAAPLSAFTVSTEYVNKQTAGISALVYTAAGIFLGRKFGGAIPFVKSIVPVA